MSILHLDLKLITDTTVELRYFFAHPHEYQRRELPLAEIADLIEATETDYFGTLPKLAREIGQALYRWLDRDRDLTQALQKHPIAVAIATDQCLAHLPWEVLHDGRSFCVQGGLIPLRWSGYQPIVPVAQPQNRMMNVVFMATSPENFLPRLNYEAEEVRILQATHQQPLQLVVEESGCLEELRQLVADPPDSFDVFHLTGHITLHQGQPHFVTETQTGDAHYASAAEIARSFAGQVPPLVFLSGCHLGQTGAAGAMQSIAATWLEAGALAVLIWDSALRDQKATAAVEALYQTLAAGGTVLQAVELAYHKLLAQEAWDGHLLRLYVSQPLPEALVTCPDTVERKELSIAPAHSQFLNPAEFDLQKRIKVPTREDFVGRRRQIQYCLRSLLATPTDRLGVLIHGMGGVGKSSLAAQLCNRLIERTPIVWVGRIDAVRFCHRLQANLSADLRRVLIDSSEALRYRLRDVFVAWDGQPWLLVWDNFEDNLEPTPTGYELSAAAAEVLAALTWAISETNIPHRIIITCRYDLASAHLEAFNRQPMAAMHGAELAKKCVRLQLHQRGTTALQTEVKIRSGGNPRLLEELSQCLTDSTPNLVAAVTAFKPLVLATSLQRQLARPENLALVQMLAAGRVFTIPVPPAAMAIACKENELTRLLPQAIALGLMEVSPNGNLHVPAILGLTVPLIAEAVFAELAICLYQEWWQDKSTATEVQQQEIHRLALLGKVKAIAVEIADTLASCLHNRNCYQEALEISQQTLEYFEDYRILYNVARTQTELGDLEAAAHNYQTALDQFPTENNAEILKQKAALLHNFATLKASQCHDIAGAINLYQQALALQMQIGDIQSQAATLCQMGRLKANQSDTAEAIDLYQQALALQMQIGDVQSQAATLCQMGSLKANQSDIAGAIDLYQQSCHIFEQIGYVQGQAATLHQMGSLKANQGDIVGAIDLYQQALALQAQIGDVRGQAATLHQFGNLKANQGEMTWAIGLYQQALALQAQMGDVQGQVATFYQMGKIQINQGDLAGAIALYQQALALNEQIGDVQGQAVILHQMGSLKANQGDLAGAIDLYQQALDLQAQIGNVQDQAATLAMMGQLVAAQGNFATAIGNLEKSVAILEHMGSSDVKTVEAILARVVQMQQDNG